MRKKELKAVITFQNTTSAMAMEKLCKAKGLPGRLIPVPQSITAGCGLAWIVYPMERQEIELVMEENKVLYEKIYEIEI